MPLMFWAKPKTDVASERTKSTTPECHCVEGEDPCSVTCAVKRAAEELDEQIRAKRKLREKVQKVTREIEETPPFLATVSQN